MAGREIVGGAYVPTFLVGMYARLVLVMRPRWSCLWRQGTMPFQWRLHRETNRRDVGATLGSLQTNPPAHCGAQPDRADEA